MASIKKLGHKLLSEEELEEVREAANQNDCAKIRHFINVGWDVNQQLDAAGLLYDVIEEAVKKYLKAGETAYDVFIEEPIKKYPKAGETAYDVFIEEPIKKYPKAGETAYDVFIEEPIKKYPKAGETAYDVFIEEPIKKYPKEHMKQTCRSRKMEQSVQCGGEMKPHVPEGATAGSSDQCLGASAAPSDKQLGSMLERYAYSKGQTIAVGKGQITITVNKRNDGDLDILEVVTRQSDYFPLLQSPTQLTGSTTQFHAPGKNVMWAELHKSLSDALQSVALLARADRTGVGSGFRVGPTYVMTNCHVLKELSHEPEHNVALFHSNKPRQVDGVVAVPIRAILAHCEDLDVAVLDLNFEASLPIAFNRCLKISECPLPPPITEFATIDAQRYIHFVGHPVGDGKVLDTMCTIDYDCTSSQNIEKLLGLHRKYEKEMFKNITDARRALYQSSSKFGNGSSGSPGFVANHQQEACVAVMHTCGHDIRVAPGEFHLKEIEQGVRMEFIYDFLLNDYPDLCADIFHGKRPDRVL